FAGYQENKDQIDAAERARAFVDEEVAPFRRLSGALSNSKATKRQRTLATSMTAMRFKIQWVQGNAEKAEASFYRINLRSVPLDKTEIKLIRDRKKPRPIATRAIVQNAAGHPFWKSFPERKKRLLSRNRG